MTDSHNDPDRRHSWRLSAAAALAGAFALLAAACGSPTPTLLPDRPSADAARQLRDEIDTLLATPGLERATWGVVARSPISGATLYTRNPGSLLMPASAMKVVTLAAAADRLGWDHVYETTILGVGAIDFGFLDGDLLVVGAGDPSFDDWAGAATVTFNAWAERLKALGVRVVGGRIIGDDNAFDDEALGMGWTWEDLGASYSAGVAALQINQNSARVWITAGANPGQAAHARIEPDYSDLKIDASVTTTSAETPASISIRRMPGSTRLELRGTVPAGAAPFARTVSVNNPTLYFAQALKQALVNHGIEVRGPAVDIDDVSNPPARDQGVQLLAHRSAPLRNLASTLMKDSQNLYAETLLKSIAVTPGQPGSTEAGVASVSGLLEEWNVSDGTVLMTDGSGLSRYNLVTADALASILVNVYRDDYLRGPFQASLAVAGRDGTLTRRMAGSPAQDVVIAKTGSFSNARSLAGFVVGPDGEPIAFAILANNFGSAGPLVEATIDAIANALVTFSRRPSRDGS